MAFKEGQLIIYKGSNGYEIGIIKKIRDSESAWIWYTGGDTAELTDIENNVYPVINDYCIKDLISKL